MPKLPKYLRPVFCRRAAPPSAEQGLVVSAHGYGVEPRPERFPSRNRIITAIADDPEGRYPFSLNIFAQLPPCTGRFRQASRRSEMSWKKIVVLLAALVAVAVIVPTTSEAATHYLSQSTIVKTLINTQGTAWCAHGWHVTGGGFSSSEDMNGRVYAQWDGPTVNNSTHNQGWAVKIDAPGPIVGGPSPLIYVYADCVN